MKKILFVTKLELCAMIKEWEELLKMVKNKNKY
jgi:hypothetical protein